MFELLEVLVVLLFVIGTTAFFASALYEVVANWFNIRGAFFRRHLKKYIHELQSLTSSSFTINDFDEVNKRIAVGSSYDPNKSHKWYTKFRRPQNRFPEKISATAMAAYLGVKPEQLKDFTIHYSQFEEQLTNDYKSQVKRYLFIPGFLLAFGFHVNLVDIASYTFENDDVRNAAVASIKEKVKGYEFPTDSATIESSDNLKQDVMNLLSDFNQEFTSMGIPIGWESAAYTNWERDIALLEAEMLQHKVVLCAITGCQKWTLTEILRASGNANAAPESEAYKAAQSMEKSLLTYQLKWGETQTSCNELNTNYINLKEGTAPGQFKDVKGWFIPSCLILALCSMMGGPYWFELIGKIVGR